jgi:hypothetical protein
MQPALHDEDAAWRMARPRRDGLGLLVHDEATTHRLDVRPLLEAPLEVQGVCPHAWVAKVTGSLVTVCGQPTTWAAVTPAYAAPLCPTCRPLEPARADQPVAWPAGQEPRRSRGRDECLLAQAARERRPPQP